MGKAFLVARLADNTLRAQRQGSAGKAAANMGHSLCRGTEGKFRRPGVVSLILHYCYFLN